MKSRRDKRHILVPWEPRVEAFSSHDRFPSRSIPPQRDPYAHAQRLLGELKQAEQEAMERRRAQMMDNFSERAEGIYLQFNIESPKGMMLDPKLFENKREHIELRALKTLIKNPLIQQAIVFVPDGKIKYFINKIEKYLSELNKNVNNRNREFIDRISSVRLATLKALWTDTEDVFPEENQPIWWEIWLRRNDESEYERFVSYAKAANLKIKHRRIEFEDRVVVLAYGTAVQLSSSLDILNDLAELRRAKEMASFFVYDISYPEQVDWVNNLLDRVDLPPEDSPAVCILDTGVTNHHSLLIPVISESDLMSVDPKWGVNDHSGHGTNMAGLAAYGDLVHALLDRERVRFRHRLESVKILPPSGANDPDSYGAITAEAVSLPLIHNPNRKRVFSMAITASDQRDRGQPTSWSAAIDALAAGLIITPTEKGMEYLGEGERRLFVISAGNIPRERLVKNYLERCDLEPVFDPGQAWNALTVGAYTEKGEINAKDFSNFSPLAIPGDLSPISTTSVSFDRIWPIKPDVVFEGGNWGIDKDGNIDSVPDLSLLATYYKPNFKIFELTGDTSAATAQVARMAALIAAEYPEFWPETLRALIVHSARWTKQMKSHLNSPKKNERLNLLRRYGYGVPDLDRALRSTGNSLTMIIQSKIRPYEDGKTKEMHLYELPWPTEVLRDLEETPVELRVTLSYFIEPNPARRGWNGRYRYPSHALRFALKRETESIDEFRKRINQKALEEGEVKPSSPGGMSKWYFGEGIQSRGSIHSDIWEGTAAELAELGVIAIYPVSGWWKEKTGTKKWKTYNKEARYALVVSIDVGREDVDIWTPVAFQVGVPVDFSAIGLVEYGETE